MSKLSWGLGLGVGYIIGARAGRARFEQIKSAAVSFAERSDVQQAVGKVKTALPAKLQRSVGDLSQRTSRRRPAGTAGVSVVETPASSLPDPGTVGDLPTDALLPPDPFIPPGQSDDPGGRPL